ncbi:MAG: MFS transporter [Anaerolineae bacterium]|jgi:MFS family permease|nr:MFS transporter [Anaerolineae bacterium]
MSVQTPVASPSAKVNPWLILALVSIPVFIGALDLTIVSAFLPELIIGLNLPLQTGLDDAAWIVSGYLLAYAVSMTFMGRVSDLVGRRTVYVICLIVFMVGSVIVALGDSVLSDWVYSLFRRAGQRPDQAYVSLGVIIFGRVVQALGAGALVPVSLALVADLFPAAQRARPLGIIGAVDTLGWVLGHLYGGIFIQFLPWQGLFWANVPLTLIALGLTLWAMRGVKEVRHKGRFDALGALLIVLALSGLTLGLGANIEVGTAVSSFEELSPLPPYAAPVLIGAGLAFVLFLLVESRVREPLVNLKLFRKPGVSAGSLTNLLVGYVLFAGLVFVPILVNVRQLDAGSLREAALQVGILLSALTIPMALAAVGGGWVSERFGVRNTTVLGLALSVVGFGWVWLTWEVGISDVLVAVQMVVAGVGIGLTFSPISASVINAADEAERGVASALVIVLRLVGMTLSVSTLTTIALNRVNTLAAERLGAVFDPVAFPDQYAAITVEVLGEMGLLVAILSAIAIVPALFMPNDKMRGE